MFRVDVRVGEIVMARLGWIIVLVDIVERGESCHRWCFRQSVRGSRQLFVVIIFAVNRTSATFGSECDPNSINRKCKQWILTGILGGVMRNGDAGRIIQTMASHFVLRLWLLLVMVVVVGILQPVNKCH